MRIFITRFVSEGRLGRWPETSRKVSPWVTLFDVALFLGFRAEGPAIYIAQPIGLGKEA